jgi:hypothetical protein
MAQRNGTKGARAVTTAGSRNDAFAAQFSVGATAAVRVVRGATADSPSPKREASAKQTHSSDDGRR